MKAIARAKAEIFLGLEKGAAAILNPPHPPVVVVAPKNAPAVEAPPLSANEQQALAGAQLPADAAKALSAKDQKKQDEANRKREKAEQELQAKAAKDQTKRDAEAARVAAEQAKRQAQIEAAAAKTAGERAKRQAEAERTRQKALDEAAAKAKQAEAKYQSDISRQSK